MKTAAIAGALADALALAASITDESKVDTALAAPHVTAGISTNASPMTVITNIRAHAIAVTAPTQVEMGGVAKLSALAATLLPEIDIHITSDDTSASVTCGRSATKPEA